MLLICVLGKFTLFIHKIPKIFPVDVKSPNYNRCRDCAVCNV